MRKLKLQRLKEEYDLEGLDDELKHQYENQNKALRDLAAYVNIEIARQFFQDKPFSPEHVYRVLNEPDEFSKRTETELRKRLSEEGIDIDELRKDWVEHMTVRSYLNRVLNIDTSRQRQSRTHNEVLTDIRGVLNQEESIIAEILETVDDFDGEKWDIHTDLRLINDKTGESIRVEDYFRELDSS
ncbi:hypothetical protein RH831_02005 [Halodesulfurarchaeum sp. HSR-GB]|uniref:rod-determining factor RdfA n=1 Tax=Halodesulfurarchaeum sp. HSR-GB TaxID=3074077 RepID=UPI002866497B|nr:rod-determining factor RdfA [Halodesulfurarchaeum sp. HSR-GB]MDR5655957.1 hypothetical protein [Halodesulfurarchaeum sp. HSR-GB]